MSRKGENIYKRKDGRWEARYIKGRSASGKAQYGYIYAHSYTEVKKKRTETLKQITIEIDGKRKDSFNYISQQWLTQKKIQIKESSYIKYKNIVNTYLLKKFYSFNIDEIDAMMFEDFCQELLCSGGQKQTGLSSKTVNDILSVIRSILQYANRKGYYTQCTGKEFKIKHNPRTLTVLSIQEQNILQNYLLQNQTNRNLGILLCLFSGIRIGELCALKWDDISLPEKSLYIHSSLQRLQKDVPSEHKTKIIIAPPKSVCSIRTIPLPQELVDLLNKVENKSGFFLTGKDSIYEEPRTIENYFDKVLDLCNLKKVNFHALRHTFATRCIELGFDIKCLSEILGHSNVSITLNRYVHPSIEVKRLNMDRLSNLIAVK